MIHHDKPRIVRIHAIEQGIARRRSAALTRADMPRLHQLARLEMVMHAAAWTEVASAVQTVPR